MDLGFSLLGWKTGASGVLLHAGKHGEMSGEASFPQFPLTKAGGAFQVSLPDGKRPRDSRRVCD